jgi:hypothetical protein
MRDEHYTHNKFEWYVSDNIESAIDWLKREYIWSFESRFDWDDVIVLIDGKSDDSYMMDGADPWIRDECERIRSVAKAQATEVYEASQETKRALELAALRKRQDAANRAQELKDLAEYERLKAKFNAS